MPARARRSLRLVMFLAAALSSAVMFGAGALVTQVFAVVLVANGVRVVLRSRS
jgi:hypothetical protein